MSLPHGLYDLVITEAVGSTLESQRGEGALRREGGRGGVTPIAFFDIQPKPYPAAISGERVESYPS